VALPRSARLLLLGYRPASRALCVCLPKITIDWTPERGGTDFEPKTKYARWPDQEIGNQAHPQIW
jgi:hypothetical protein